MKSTISSRVSGGGYAVVANKMVRRIKIRSYVTSIMLMVFFVPACVTRYDDYGFSLGVRMQVLEEVSEYPLEGVRAYLVHQELSRNDVALDEFSLIGMSNTAGMLTDDVRYRWGRAVKSYLGKNLKRVKDEFSVLLVKDGYLPRLIPIVEEEIVVENNQRTIEFGRVELKLEVFTTR